MEKAKKAQINNLARLFYQMMGYNVDEGYDFSTKTHPQEYGVWNQAVVAWAILKKDMSVRKYQV